MEDFEEWYRKIKAGLERAYIEWKTPMFANMDPQESRDIFYEVIEEELWKAKRLHRAGDENGVKRVLRRAAKVLPTVNLKTPEK